MKVLVVDDCFDTAEMFAALLDQAGFASLVAHDPGNAFDMAAHDRPDVILLDLGLPHRTDGAKLCRRIRRQTWGQRPFIIAISGWVQLKDQDAARLAGCNEFLTKPVPFELLHASILRGIARTTVSGRSPYARRDARWIQPPHHQDACPPR